MGFVGDTALISGRSGNSGVGVGFGSPGSFLGFFGGLPGSPSFLDLFGGIF